MDVLLVDDSRLMRQLVRRTLRQAGYELGQVVEAEHGRDALARLKGWRPDLVLSDWNMPEMSGIDLLAALRGQPVAPPLGFVTSESTPSMRKRAEETGALFLITKPFTPADFRTVLSAAGIRPSGALTGATGAVLDTLVFNERSVGDVIGRLVGPQVTAAPGPRIIPAAMPCVSATWIDTNDAIAYAGFCDLPAAAYLGAAIGLRPVGSVKEVLASRVLPESLQADVREVLNVLSRLFNDCGTRHVRLSKTTFPPAPPLADALRLDAPAAVRRDYLLQIQGYGAGKLSLISSGPAFIV